MSAGSLALVPTPYDDPVAAGLVETLQREYVQRYGGGDRTPVDPGEFAPPRGLFLVGRVDGVPMACGGWRLVPGEPELAEVKRMYVAVDFRGRGLSRVVLAALEASARAAGVRRFRLETGARQPEGLQLYRTSGYESVERFGIYAEHQGSNFLGKNL